MPTTRDINPGTLRIKDLLMSVPKGETVALDHITAVLGQEIRTRRHLVYSAMHLANKESDALFACVRGVGYRRLRTGETSKVGQTVRKRVGKMSARGITSMRAGISHASDIRPEDLRRVYQEITSLGMIQFLSRDRNLPTVSESAKAPSVAMTARTFLLKCNAAFQESPPPPNRSAQRPTPPTQEPARPLTLPLGATTPGTNLWGGQWP